MAQTSRALEHSKGDPGFSDQRLANLQFASAASSGVGAGRLSSNLLVKAGRKIALDQGSDGGWHIDEESRVGSPATYGPHLATFLAWKLLSQSGRADLEESARGARGWLQDAPVQNVPSAAVFLMAFGRETQPEIAAKAQKASELLRGAQGNDGGWGAYADAPPEVFDTSLALLGLVEMPASPQRSTMLARGRAFLMQEQNVDGSWAATTRPSGGKSYAQQISTTAWATIALLSTAD